MDRLIHTSMSALRASMQRQAANANNLANANTVGFKAEMSAAQSLWLQGGAHQTRAFAAESVLSSKRSTQPGVAIPIRSQSIPLG